MIAILRRRLFVILLFRRRRMLVLRSRYFTRSRLRVNAALAPVVADSRIVVVVVDNRFVYVGIVNHGAVDVGHGGVVTEGVSIPSTADVARAEIPEAITDAAIESHGSAPVTSVPIVRV